VVEDVLSHGGPRTDSAASPPETSIAYDPCSDTVIATGKQVLCEDFIYECFFRLAFDVYQQARHPQPLTGRPPNSFFSHSWPRL
jgi:hypothetical protein